jgi:phospholipid transport system substrate-binding protein
MQLIQWVRSLRGLLGRTLVVAACATLAMGTVRAEEGMAPDALIKAVSSEVIEAAKADKSLQAGDLQKVIVLVDSKVMPHVNFDRMTIATVGARHWKTATDEQKKRLLEEYKSLLMRTYAGALSMVKDQTVQVSPSRAQPGDTDVLVRTKVKGGSEPIQLDYRLEKTNQGWKIYDVNVAGFWLTEQFRSSWAQEISANGLDGLIAALAKRNKSAAAAAAKG